MEVLEPVRLPGRLEAEVRSVARALLLHLFWGSACSAFRAESCTLCSYCRHLCFLSVFSMPLALQGPLVSVEVHALHIYLPESFSSPAPTLLAAFLSEWTPSLCGVCTTSLPFVCAQALYCVPLCMWSSQGEQLSLFRDTTVVVACYQSEQGLSSCLLQE